MMKHFVAWLVAFVLLCATLVYAYVPVPVVSSEQADLVFSTTRPEVSMSIQSMWTQGNEYHVDCDIMWSQGGAPVRIGRSYMILTEPCPMPPVPLPYIDYKKLWNFLMTCNVRGAELLPGGPVG